EERRNLLAADPRRGAGEQRAALERATRIELAFSAWEADVLPLNYARDSGGHCSASRSGRNLQPQRLIFPPRTDRARQGRPASSAHPSGPTVIWLTVSPNSPIFGAGPSCAQIWRLVSSPSSAIVNAL